MRFAKRCRVKLITMWTCLQRWCVPECSPRMDHNESFVVSEHARLVRRIATASPRSIDSASAARNNVRVNNRTRILNHEPTFETIGLEVSSEKAFNYLAERAGDQGEATQLSRRGAVLHGRCWKLGEGLEVWTVLYESGSGDVFYADCRPGFRARYIQTIAPWALTEYDEEGEAVVHGFREGTDCEVLFELQNLTEVGPGGLWRAGVARWSVWSCLSRARASRQSEDALDASGKSRSSERRA